MSTNRTLLDLLGRDTLVRLSRERDLAPTRENDERRKALAHSYHGDVESLVLDLTRHELVDLFMNCTFDVRGVESYLLNPAKYRLDELQAFAIRAFAGRRVRIPADFVPVDAADDEIEEEDAEEEDDDRHSESFSVRELLRVDSEEWSRPRMMARIFSALDEEPPQRLRTERFQMLIQMLAADKIEACLADDPRMRVLTGDDSSPGIEAKLRLRLRADSVSADEDVVGDDEENDDDDEHLDAVLGVLGGSRRPLKAREIAERIGLSRADVNAILYRHARFFEKDEATFTWSVANKKRPQKSTARDASGGPQIVVQAGEKPIPVQVARPSDYNLAVLRLQFLTAVPSVERRSLTAWPDGYIAAATRGLSLQPRELALLRAYAAGLCIGNHSPYDAIPRLTQVLSPTDWENLLDDFQTLNPFQPELVQTIVEQVAPITAPRSSARVWREAAPPPADLSRPPHEVPAIQPVAAASSRTSPEAPPETGAANKRDLGALAGMFDEE